MINSLTMDYMKLGVIMCGFCNENINGDIGRRFESRYSCCDGPHIITNSYRRVCCVCGVVDPLKCLYFK